MDSRTQWNNTVFLESEREITDYECESCEGCPPKKSCTRAKSNQKMQLSNEFLRQREQSLENKLHHKTQANRTGSQLFKKLTA